MAKVVLAILLGAALACSGSGTDAGPGAKVTFVPDPALKDLPAVIEPTAGTRLTILVDRTDDGAEIPRVWFDREKKSPCYWSWAADGVLRCHPAAGGWGNLFLDSSCTERAHVRRDDSCFQWEFLMITHATCPEGRLIAPVGEKVETRTVYFLEKDLCRPSPLSAGTSVFAVGEEIPASEWVGATVRAGEARDGRLAPKILDAEDGSRAFYRWYDTREGVDCVPTWAADGKLRCLPSTADSRTDYFDAAWGFFRAGPDCESVLVPAGSTTCPDSVPRFHQLIDDRGCRGRTIVRTLSRERVREPYMKYGTQCGKLPPGREDYLPLGPELEPRSFAEISEGFLPGTARLRARILGTAAQKVVSFRSFWDSELGAPCTAAPAGDGVIRCLPTSTRYSQPLHMDSGCADAVTVVTGASCEGAFLGKSEGPSCERRTRVYSVSPHPLDGPLFLSSENKCSAVPASSESQAFVVGDEVPPDELVPIR